VIRAAIYARKSTEQQTEDADKSVTRQIALAKTFAVEKGWTVADDHIYVDDGISGVVTSKLVARARMLAAATEERFATVIVRDLDRLGRNDEELPGLIYTLRDAGVEVWSYADRSRVETESALQRGMLSMKATFAGAEREAAQKRTREQKRAKAAQGRIADGRVLGYRTVGDPKARRREIDPEQAKIVVRIFEMCAGGKGIVKIAKTLNAEGIVNPTGQIRTNTTKTSSKLWAASGIRAVLFRELYRGKVVYGATQNVYRRGHRVRVTGISPVTVERPDLRIISESLWSAAHARLKQARRAYLRHTDGTLDGRPGNGLESQHLLSSLLRCGICGGGLVYSKKWGKRGRPTGMYVCAQHRTRGDAACVNRLGVPAVELTDQVLAQIKNAFLDPVALGALLMKKFNEAKAAPEALEADRKDVAARIARLGQEIERLTNAIATGAAPSSVVQAITDREAERRDLQAKLEHLNGLALVAEEFDAAEFLEEIQEVLDDLRSSLEADVVRGRRTLQRLLTAPITVTPTETGFEFAGAASWLGYDEQLRAAVMKKEQLTGRFERRHRRSKIWWPRGDSNTRHAV
jgi:site-specific DNA recombinase